MAVVAHPFALRDVGAFVRVAPRVGPGNGRRSLVMEGVGEGWIVGIYAGKKCGDKRSQTIYLRG